MSKKNESCAFRTSIGGQALIEGILMRGPEKQAIVCRTPDGLVTRVEELKLVKSKHPILGWPLIRGVVNFIDSMAKGMKALTYSAELLPEDEQLPAATALLSAKMEEHCVAPACNSAILHAHETLMAANPENIARFKDVVAFMREDLGKNL